MKTVRRIGIFKNEDQKFYEKIALAVRKNDNYCPCVVGAKDKGDAYKCMCKPFLDQSEGFCLCKRYFKKEIVREVSDGYELKDGESFVDDRN